MSYNTATINATRRVVTGNTTTTEGTVIGGWRIVGPAHYLSYDAHAVGAMACEAGVLGDLLRVNELQGGYVFRPFTNPVAPHSPYFNRWVFPVEQAA